jgi:hypothetical protein
MVTAFPPGKSRFFGKENIPLRGLDIIIHPRRAFVK